MNDVVDISTSRRFANMSLLCAVLVVSIHIGKCKTVGAPAWWFNEIVSSGIAGIAIPFFFFASGYFLAVHMNEDGWWRNALEKRTITLLVPFIVWNLVYLAFSRFSIGGNFISWFGLHPLRHPALFVLWYVRALVLLVLVSPVIIFALRKTCGWILAAIWIVYFLFVPGDEASPTNCQLFFKWSFSLLGLFYFSLGCWARNCKWGRCGWKVTVSAMVLGVLFLSIQTWVRYIGLVLPISPRPAMVFCLFIGMFSMMTDRAMPKFLAGAAFPIYVCHVFVRIVPFRFLNTDSIWQLIATWMITVVGCIALAVTFRKLYPKGAAFIFGGR